MTSSDLLILQIEPFFSGLFLGLAVAAVVVVVALLIRRKP